MKRIALFLGFCLVMVLNACQTEKKPSIDQQKQAYEANPNAETGLALLEGYLAAVKADPKSPDVKEYLNQGVRVAFDHKLPNQYLEAVEVYAENNPGDANVPEYLYSAAEIAKNANDIPRALQYYDKIHKDFGDHPKAPTALFLKAYLYDDELNDVKTARTLYEEFLRRYPNNAFADDAQVLMENLGLTDEEMLEAVRRKQQEAAEAEG